MQGAGGLYLYIPRFQDSSYCLVPPSTICGCAYGDTVGLGSFGLQAGKWNRLRQYVQLNTFDDCGRPVRDGVVIVWTAVDGQDFPKQPALDFRKLVLRTDKSATFLGLRFETLQEGRSDDLVDPLTRSDQQQAYFRNFRLWAY